LDMLCLQHLLVIQVEMPSHISNYETWHIS
jgi:hypothetical protein